MEETWKPFPLDDRFLISDAGRVQGPRVVLKLQHDKDGYSYFIAWRGTRAARTYKLHKMHRVVVQTFVGDIPEGMHVNHINGVKDDNRLDNLEVITPRANTVHSFVALGRKGANTNPVKGERHHNSRLTSEQVIEMRRLHASGAAQKTLAAQFDTPQTNVSRIIRREAWAHV